MEDRRVQMVQLYICTSQLETLRVQEHARTQDLAIGRSGGDWSWTRAQTAGGRWHARGGSAAHARLCARPMTRSRLSLRALISGTLALVSCVARVDRRVTGERVCLRTTRWQVATSEGESRTARRTRPQRSGGRIAQQGR